MRGIAWLFVWCAVVLNSGCAIWEKETTNRGGYLDYLTDQHWLKADSKGMRALRAFAIQVSLARVASVSAKNDSDRQLLAIRIGATTKRFLPVLGCAFDKNPLDVAGAETDPCFFYDSAMVDYSTALFELAKIALPEDDVTKLKTIVTGSVVNPLNLADLLDALLIIGRDALKYGRVVGALYRDTVELEVQAWLATPAIDSRPDSVRVTEAHVAALREIYDRKNDDMAAWIAAIAVLRGQGLEPMAHPKFFKELGGLMKYICGLITSEAKALAACTDGLPTTLPAPVAVLRPISTANLSMPARIAIGTPAQPVRPIKTAPSVRPDPIVRVDPAVGSDSIAKILTTFVNSQDPRAPNSPTKIITRYLNRPDADTAAAMPAGQVFVAKDVVSKPGFEQLRKALLKRACKEQKITGADCALAN